MSENLTTDIRVVLLAVMAVGAFLCTVLIIINNNFRR
jgi:hypothetical protein